MQAIKNGIFALSGDGIIYQLNGSDEYDYWSFETDFYAGRTVDIKHISKIQLLADVKSGASFKIQVSYDKDSFDEANIIYESSVQGLQKN